MSEAITNTLKFAFGLISDKLRTYGAEKLQGGDLTDQKFRGLLVRELDDIKTKLDGLSRKDLATSISWLKQAVQRLHMAVGEMVESGSQCTSDLPKKGNQPQDATNTVTYSVQPVQQSLTVESALALASAMGRLKIESNELFGLAKQSFNEAGKKACEAFHNASLSTEERILACKVRIASGILEHLDHLEVAASDCLQCLQELHDMPEIQEIFSVHINGGIKAIFKRKSRAEIVQTVTIINLFLSDFISKYTKQRMAVLDWPLIKRGKQVFHPIHFDKMSLPNLKEIEVTPPWDTVVLEDVNIINSLYTCDFNKGGNLICFIRGRSYLQELDKTTGMLLPYGNTQCIPAVCFIIGLTVDEDDTVYVLLFDKEDGYKLSVYSADGRLTDQSILNFSKTWELVRISVTKDKNIVICYQPFPTAVIKVYLYKSNGQLINSFRPDLEDHTLKYVFTPCNEIILTTTDWDNLMLHIYTEDGYLKKTVKCPSARVDLFCRIFYNQVTKNIVSYYEEFDTGKIVVDHLSSETGELQCSYVLHTTNLPNDRYTFYVGCHTNGALALVGTNHVIILQTPSM